MGGNRSSKPKKGRKLKSKSWRNLCNNPGTSRDPSGSEALSSGNQETEDILPSTSASIETISQSVEEPSVAINAPDEHKTNKMTRIASSFFEKRGLLYQCGGSSKRSCEICFPKKMAGYQKMEDEQYRADHPDGSVRMENNLILNFFLESPSVKEYATLLATPTTTAADAVKGVALNHKTEDHYIYTIVEHWKDYEAERILEDHELIIDVRREQVSFYENKMKFVFIYRVELEKYEYIIKKEEFFIHPNNMESTFESHTSRKKTDDPLFIQVLDPFFSKKNVIQEPPIVRTVESSDNVVESSLSIIQRAPEEISEDDLVNPVFGSTIFVKVSNKDLTIAQINDTPGQKEKCYWRKKYLLLRDRILYLVDTHHNMVKYYYLDSEKFREVLKKLKPTVTSKKELQLVGPIADFQIYSGLGIRRYYNAPYGGGIYLKKQDGATNRPIRLLFCCKKAKNCSDPNNFTRKLWLAAMRLAKHGTQIKENYLQYENEKKQYIMKLKLKMQANNPRVAMDFSYGVGRVVDDPEEAAQIARGEFCGSSSVRPPRFQSLIPAPEDCLSFGPHLTQGYYHANLNREQAEEMIIRTATNGAFILRNSKNRPGCLVITYLHALRPHHQYVTPVVFHDKIKKEDVLLATCDKDIVFYDVHSLIEYHRLNKGSLQCILTMSIRNPQQPDGTPPRRRKPAGSPKFRTASPQAGPSTEVSSTAREASASPPTSSDSEREQLSITPIQTGLDTDTSSETAAIESTAQIDLLTSLEIHPQPSSLIPSLSPSPSASPSREGGGTSPGALSSEETSPKSTPSPPSQIQCGDSPKV